MSSGLFDETQKLVLSLYGSLQLDLVRPCLESVVDRQNYARFHYFEIRDILERYVSTQLNETTLLDLKLDMFLGADDEAADDFFIFNTKIGAHFTACIQCLHAVADILGHALYYALAINKLANRLPEKFYASDVLGRIKDNPELAPVHALFGSLFAGGNFDHLVALVNLSKHRSVVRPFLKEDLKGLAQQRHMLKICSFARKGKTADKNREYPEVSIKEFLESEYNRCSGLVIEIGNSLNAVLRARNCPP